MSVFYREVNSQGAMIPYNDVFRGGCFRVFVGNADARFVQSIVSNQWQFRVVILQIPYY